jgi:hypothetical protein
LPPLALTVVFDHRRRVISHSFSIAYYWPRSAPHPEVCCRAASVSATVSRAARITMSCAVLTFERGSIRRTSCQPPGSPISGESNPGLCPCRTTSRGGSGATPSTPLEVAVDFDPRHIREARCTDDKLHPLAPLYIGSLVASAGTAMGGAAGASCTATRWIMLQAPARKNSHVAVQDARPRIAALRQQPDRCSIRQERKR